MIYNNVNVCLQLILILADAMQYLKHAQSLGFSGRYKKIKLKNVEAAKVCRLLIFHRIVCRFLTS